MANPAPTINQINAFNATQGTTIDFNIIGGTELVRSNRIYIYDLSDNSLICTHLYVSTESIHELPPNTDGSIVYESGKSSADFVNGAQYYAQIQTFTDIAGTEGGSGLSVAKMFWCLVDPTLTITTIPSTISTTSYNVSATYDANTSVVSNIIQQYQFSLYSATGSLLQSSGVVVGSGTQQGTSTTYDISYNFTGLSVGSSYYVVVDVTTTQGMSVSVQSNTFTVSIDTPTLGEATVVNNACDGYISVTSNLSGEYGGSGSGDIVSFETDSENVFTKLQVDLEPVQDLHGYDKPWVGGAGKNLFNASATTNLRDFSRNGETFTNTNTDTRSNAVFNVIYYGNGSLISVSNSSYVTIPRRASLILNVPSGTDTLRIRDSGSTRDLYFDYPFSGEGYYTISADFTSVDPTTVGGLVIKNIQIESGQTETAWTPYSNICPISGHDEVDVYDTGVNVWDEEIELGRISSTDGSNVTATDRLRSKNYISVKPNTSYFFMAESIATQTASNVYGYYYDINKNFISDAAINHIAITTPSNAYYMRFMLGGVYGTTFKNDVSLNYPSTDHNYHAYNGQTYTTTLPSTTYGGTLDLVSGVLTVTHGIVDLGSLNWNYNPNWGGAGAFYCNPAPTNIKGYSDSAAPNAISSMYECLSRNAVYNSPNANGLCIPSNGQVSIRNSAYTDATSFKTAMNGVQLVYALATPITYQLTPQQIQTLVGVNNVWSEQGDIELSYHIPITNLLVKRQDVADVSGDWLTLYSQPITQASDMDFTFIDFTNQYGKTYKYALVPLLTQTQSGVEVEVEGGYTVSDEVQSVFDGVFIADSIGSQKCKANVGYGNVDMNQTVGTITPIGAKYPVVITNSKNQYHNGSISGTIVPDDYYFNGNLSRVDMVNKRDELEQFLTNKRAKIIKDWNGKIWLVMIMDNVSCTFNNNYGMGIVNFSTNWIEVGDPTNQEDLQATGLINVGGV